MYLSYKLSTGIFLVFLACAFANAQDPSGSPSLTEESSLETLSVNLVTDIKITNSYAEATYTYKLSARSEEPLDLTLRLPNLDRIYFLSLTATFDDETKTSLIVDPLKLKTRPAKNPKDLEQNSHLVKLGTLQAGKSGIVVISAMEEFEAQGNNQWSLTLPLDLTVGPFFVEDSRVSNLEKWDINVNSDNKLELVKNSGLSQNAKGGFTLQKGDSNLQDDLVLRFREKQYPGWNAILEKHPEHNEDYVLFLDFSLEKEIKAKDQIKGPITVESISLLPSTKREALGELPFGRDEFIIVIDRSKAIQGDSLEILKLMLEKTVSKLPKGSYFNIVTYVSKFVFYKFESVVLTDETRKEALEWISNLQDGSGSALIDNPVKLATTIPRKIHHLRTIVLFSGQDISNSDEMINFMEENSRYIRFCHINVGGQGFKNLNGDIEKNGRCLSTSVKTKQDANEKVQHLLEKITNPHLEGITLSVECFGKDGHSLYLKEDAWNYLSYGQPLRHWYHLHPAKDLQTCKGHFTFTNDTNKQEYQYQFEISINKQVNSQIWHKVAYSTLLRILTVKARYAPEGDSKHLMVTHVRDLSTKYQLFSEFTNIVLIRKAEDESEILRPVQKRQLGAEPQPWDDQDLDPSATNLLNKMFKVEEEVVKKKDVRLEALEKAEENRKTDEMLMKFVIGISIVVAILFVLGKIFVKKYEKENAALKDEQERLEKEFNERFNKKKKH